MAGTRSSVGAGLVSASLGSQPPNASASHSKVQARGRIQAGPSPGGTETFVSDCTLALPTGKTKEGLKGAPWGARTDQRWGHSSRQLLPGIGQEWGGWIAALPRSPGCLLIFQKDHSIAEEIPCQLGLFHHFLRARAWQCDGRAGAAPCPSSEARGQRVATEASGPRSGAEPGRS